jgi:hypothetical protein
MVNRVNPKIRKGNLDAALIIACMKGDDSVGIRIKTIVERLREAVKEGRL